MDDCCQDIWEYLEHVQDCCDDFYEHLQDTNAHCCQQILENCCDTVQECCDRIDACCQEVYELRTRVQTLEESCCNGGSQDGPQGCWTTVISDVRVSGDEIQIKTNRIRALDCGDGGGDWIPIFSGMCQCQDGCLLDCGAQSPPPT